VRFAPQLLERAADLSFPNAEVAQGGETFTRTSGACGRTLWPYSAPSAWWTRSATALVSFNAFEN
jgi:hypothetical protein